MDPFRRAALVLLAAVVATPLFAASGDTSSDSASGVEDCPEVFSPVCGYDNKTYPNSCYADVAEQSVAYPGVCLPPGDDMVKIDRAADIFLARAFFGVRALEGKVANFSNTQARFLALLRARGLSSSVRAAVQRIQSRFQNRGLRILQSQFQVTAETWVRQNLVSLAPQPGTILGEDISFSWGPLRQSKNRLSAVLDAEYTSSAGDTKTSFDISFEKGVFRALANLVPGGDMVLRPGAVVRIGNTDTVFKVDGFVDSPCAADAFCFWNGQSVETAWYQGNRTRRLSNGGEAFGQNLQILDSDYQSFAHVKVTPISWN